VNYITRHPEFVAPIALACVVALWLVSRRWGKAGGRAAARPNKTIARPPVPQHPPLTFDQLRDKIHREFVSRCRERLGAIPRGSPERAGYAEDVRRVIEHLIDCENPLLNRIEREMLITEVAALAGYGPPPDRPAAPPGGAIQLKVPRRSPE
jgi:hypothetical protein